MRYDAQHILLILIAFVTSFGPLALLFAQHGASVALVTAGTAGLLGFLTALGALYKTAPNDVAVVNAAVAGTLGPAAKELALNPPPKAASIGSGPAGSAMILVLVCAGFLSLEQAGCTWFQSHGGEAITDAAALAVCVLAHDQDPPVQIGVECGGVAVEDVIKILSEHKAAEARDLKAGKAVCP